MTPYYSEAGITIWHGDCREVLPSVAFDAMVTDPPYGTEAECVASDDMYPHDVIPHDVIPTCIAFGSPRHLVADLPHFRRAPDRVMAWVPSFNLSKASDGGVLFRWTPIYCWGLRRTAMSEPPFTDVFAAHDGPVTSISKPVSLMSELLRLTDGLVIDPFMGSGSTLRAAKDLGRQAIGVELSEKYCEIAARRLGQEVLDFGGVA